MEKKYDEKDRLKRITDEGRRPASGAGTSTPLESRVRPYLKCERVLVTSHEAFNAPKA